MTAEAWIALVGVVVSIVLSWSVAKDHTHKEALANAEWRGRIGAQVDAMWRLVFRTGTSEGLASGILSHNSPITANLEAFNQHPDLVAKLREFYENAGSKLSDIDLLIEIENRFTPELEAFEVAHDLKPAAALAVACYLLRPNMKFFDRRKQDRPNAQADPMQGESNG